MEIKVYVITEVTKEGEVYIASRLTYESARHIAKLGPNRRIIKDVATKSKIM